MQIRLALTTAALLTLSSAASAQNWEFTPRLEMGYRYSDNYRLDVSGNEIDVSGGMLDVSLPVSLVHPIRRVEITPRVHATLFPDESDEDSTDYYLTGLLEQRSERHTYGISADWSQEDVVRSELPSAEIDSNLGDPDTGDAGRVLSRNRRDQITANPYWRYQLSQRHRIEAGAHYLDANFDRQLVGEQRDFTNSSIYAGFGFLTSERSSLTLRARASRYETVFESDAYGAEVEWRSDYSQTAHVYLRVGGQQTDLELASGSSETSVIAGAGGRWIWPTSNLLADLVRTVGPNSAGAIVERNQVRLRLSRAVRPRLSFMAGIRGTRDEAVNEGSTYPTREYATGDFGFEWRVTRRWSILGVYNYIWQEYADEISDRSSNSVSLSVVYEPGRGE